jgi:hypothetical protein
VEIKGLQDPVDGLKISRVLLLFLVVGLSTFCAKPSLEPPKPIHSQPLLEIFQNAEGMYQVHGNSLFFRLYDDAFAQFEIADPAAMSDRQTHSIEEVKKVKQVYIGEVEFRRISDLIRAGDVVTTKPTYQRKCCCTDANLQLAMWIRYENVDKTISLRGYCDLMEIEHPNERYSTDIPNVISEIFREVDNIRRKYGVNK